jgi:hypothetical protein
VRRNRTPLCIGQKQRWFLLKLRRDDVAFDLALTAEPEFDAWRWVDYWEPVREVIYFKRPVYARALTELADSAFPEGHPAAAALVERGDAPRPRAPCARLRPPPAERIFLRCANPAATPSSCAPMRPRAASLVVVAVTLLAALRALCDL